MIFRSMSQNNIENIFNSEDKNGNYSLSILFLYFHELMGHFKIRIKNYIKESPIKFNYKGYLISILNSKNQPIKESGKIVELYLTDFNDENKLFLLNSKNKNVNILLNYELYIGDLKEFNNIVLALIDEKNKKISNFNDYYTYYKNHEKDLEKETEEFNNLLKYEPKKNYINDSLPKYI